MMCLIKQVVSGDTSERQLSERYWKQSNRDATAQSKTRLTANSNVILIHVRNKNIGVY
jgi:hypothetical protein